jgi:hypothetical protein
LLVVFLCSCGKGNESTTIETPPLEDVLTLELTFGAENLPDEYLLARPLTLEVNSSNDIIVSDGSRLLAYDADGRPKKIIGGPGQGPGEFDRISYPAITCEDYFTAPTDRSYRSYNFFAPDYSFINRRDMMFSGIIEELEELYGWSFRPFGIFSRIYYYNPDELIVTLSASEKEQEKTVKNIYAIIHKKVDVIKSIYEHITIPGGPNINLIDGFLQYKPLPDKMIVYTDPSEHRFNENGRWFYSLFVYDLKTRERREIRKEYRPVVIPDSVIYREYPGIEDYPDEMRKSILESERQRSEKLEELKYYAPVSGLLTDNEYIFVFTFDIDPDKGRVVEVLNSITGDYIASAFFQFVPKCIRNGFAYTISTNESGFYVIEKHRIDITVYGK